MPLAEMLDNVEDKTALEEIASTLARTKLIELRDQGVAFGQFDEPVLTEVAMRTRLLNSGSDTHAQARRCRESGARRVLHDPLQQRARPDEGCAPRVEALAVST